VVEGFKSSAQGYERLFQFLKEVVWRGPP